MNNIVQSLVGLAGTAFATSAGDNLVGCLPLDPFHQWFWSLRQALEQVPAHAISPQSLERQLAMVPQEPRRQVAALISSVLKNVQEYRNGAEEGDADGAYEDFRGIVNVHSELQKLYSTQEGGTYAYPFLNALVLQSCRRLVLLTQSAAALSPHPIRHSASPRAIKDTARQSIEKSLQVSSAHMTDAEWRAESSQNDSVGDILWPLANILWRIYAQRKLHQQATELSKTFNALVPSEERRLEARGWRIPITDLTETYYWRGRLGVVLLDMRGARYWLSKAWERCPEDAWQQRRSILIRLVPVSLLLGHLPRQEVLQQYQLYEEFWPLVHAWKTGNVPAWRLLLDERGEWLRRRSIWLILFERGEVLVWRNLFRQALVLYRQSHPAASNRSAPTWVFVQAAQAAFAGSGELEEGIELEDIICAFSTMIDQGIILGQLAYSNQHVVYRPTADGLSAFPRVCDVKPREVRVVGT